MRTFIRADGRFWDVLPGLVRIEWQPVPGDAVPAVVRRFGYATSAGTSGPGVVQPVVCASEAAADAEVERHTAEKLAEGFVETTAAPWPGGFDSPTRRALEQALAD